MMSVRVAGVSRYSHGEDVAQGSMKTPSAQEEIRGPIIYIGFDSSDNSVLDNSDVCLHLSVY